MNEDETKKTKVGNRVTIWARGKKKIYVADFHYGGRHCRRSLKTTIKKIATTKATFLANQLEEGNYEARIPKVRKDKTRVEISKAIEDFISFHRTEGSRRRTVVKYEGILNRFKEFATNIGVTQLVHADLLLIDNYRASRKPELSVRSMDNEGSLLKRFFGWCLDRNLISANPLANRKFAKPAAKPRGGPTLDQINEILKSANAGRRTLMAVAAFAGVRIGEIARLRVEDVDFDGNWIRVISRPGCETKSGDDWKVPMHPRLRKLLEKSPHGETGWFFTAQPSHKYPQGGHHISPKRVNDDFIKILESLDIPAGRDGGFTFHSLRSSFKTICINAGVPREVVDIWQNHAPDRAASNLYYKLSDADSQRFIRTVPFGD